MGQTVNREDAELIHELYPVLRRFAAVVAPSDVEPDDVLHTVLARILQKKRLVELAEPAAYVKRAIVNEINSEMRSRLSARRAITRLGAETGGGASETYPSDVSDLMRLKPTERAILFLHDIQGIPFEDVAATLGMRAAAVRKAASRARRQLRSEILEEAT